MKDILTEKPNRKFKLYEHFYENSGKPTEG